MMNNEQQTQPSRPARRPSEQAIRHPKIPRDGERIFAAGSSGCGKTTLLARSLVRDVCDDGRFALVFDPTGDVSEYLARGGAASPPIAKDLVRKVRSVEDAKRALARGGLSSWFARSPVRVLVVTLEGLDYERAAALWLSLADSKDRAGWVLFADEADQLFPVSLSARGPANRILGLVRNRRQRLYATCNYPATTATRLRALTQHAVCFRLLNRKQVSACEWFGESDWFEPCLSLPKFHAVYRGPQFDASSTTELPRLDARTSPLPW